MVWVKYSQTPSQLKHWLYRRKCRFPSGQAAQYPIVAGLTDAQTRGHTKRQLLA